MSLAVHGNQPASGGPPTHRELAPGCANLIFDRGRYPLLPVSGADLSIQ